MSQEPQSEITNPQSSTERNPWAWIPTLYFAQGIPYVVVMTVSVIMYKRMGISNTDIALYTSWLYLPWVIKPLWSPLVDMFKTKRLWIVATQFIVGAALACVALTIPMPAFFQYTLAIFWLMAFSSATHDIAADGFYMLALPTETQTAFVGVRSTFYRIASITGQGLLVVLAGYIESHSGLDATRIEVSASDKIQHFQSFDLNLANSGTLAGSSLPIVVSAGRVDVGLKPISKTEVDSLLKFVKSTNLANGFAREEVVLKADSTWWDRSVGLWWTRSISKPLGELLRNTFNPKVQTLATKGQIAIVAITLRDKPADGEHTVVRVERESGGEDITVQEGSRLEFNTSNWNKKALVAFQVDSKLRAESATTFRTNAGNIPLAWSITFGILAVMFALFFVYHRFILPRPSGDKSILSSSGTNPIKAFFHVFALFFKKKNILAILSFLLLYRFAEAQLVKLVSPFLLDAREKGGIGLTTSELGIVYGTVGIIALTLGGLLGGYVASQRGLKFWLWPMVLAIHLPDAMFIYLSHLQPENFFLINAAVAIEQFGYGFGFTAYMLFMIMISEGEHKTAHYAICTGFMALGMMLPGMFSGWLQEQIGYARFFEWVLLSTIPGFIVAALVKIDPEFGKKKAA